MKTGLIFSPRWPKIPARNYSKKMADFVLEAITNWEKYSEVPTSKKQVDYLEITDNNFDPDKVDWVAIQNIAADTIKGNSFC